MSVEAPAIPTLEAATAAPARETASAAGSERRVGRFESLVSTVGVWLLYVPHHAVLRALGPRHGLSWARFVSRLHWLLTFVGVQRTTRRNFERLREHFRTDASVSTMLRKHLEMKHESFARVRVFHQHGPDAGGLRWTPSPGSEAALNAALGQQRGILAVGFHYNFFEMTAPALGQLLPGVEAVQIKLRQAHNLEHATTSVADVAMSRAVEADQKSGAEIFYIDSEKSARPLIRMLRAGKAVAVAADGTYSSDFLDAPFLDGTLRVSTGWARLAAMTGAHVLVGTDRPSDDPAARKMVVHDALQCEDDSEESVHRLVRGVVRLLEEAIVDQPWAWHPWQRFHGEVDESGVRRYQLTPTHVDAPGRAANQSHALADSRTPPATRKPRIAILCNSVTPYRLHLHRRIVEEVPEAELWTLSTHGNAYDRWSGSAAPAEIRPVEFGEGEPTNEQTMWRYSPREWRKGGEVIRWLRENKADAVFCQGCGDVGRLRVLRWCHKNGVPALLTGDFNTRGYTIPWWKRPLKRLVYGPAVAWSDGLAPCGRLGLDLLRSYGGKDKPGYAFPFLPDTSLYADPPAEAVERIRERFGFDPARRRMVFSARMMPVKRPDLAIEAFAEIADRRPEWDLVMVGDGVLRERSEALVPLSLQRRVIWTGFFDYPEEVAAVYHLSDALLLPSDHEPWGVVVVEAAAAGLAILSTDVVGAAPELVHPGRNGETLPAGNSTALAEAMLRVTAADRVDAMKRESPRVLDEWLGYADPVDNFRRALRDFRLIPDGSGAQAAGQTGDCEIPEKSSV